MPAGIFVENIPASYRKMTAPHHGDGRLAEKL